MQTRRTQGKKKAMIHVKKVRILSQKERQMNEIIAKTG